MTVRVTLITHSKPTSNCISLLAALCRFTTLIRNSALLLMDARIFKEFVSCQKYRVNRTQQKETLGEEGGRKGEKKTGEREARRGGETLTCTTRTPNTPTTNNQAKQRKVVTLPTLQFFRRGEESFSLSGPKLFTVMHVLDGLVSVPKPAANTETKKKTPAATPTITTVATTVARTRT